YDTAAHHHHRPGTDAARCVACHMPSRLYMVVDRRHDHGFRVPRPDLSVSLGTPNACTDCHRDRPAAWVSEAVAKWYGPTRARGPSWARALAAGRRREAGAGALLAAVAVEEYRAAQALNADRADAWLNLGALAARLGGEGRAEEAYRRAVRLQPSFMPPYVNLADLYRAQGRDPEGERVLREALAREPGAADV